MPKRSKVQPFEHLLGTVHDSVIATLAKTTTEAVFEHRKKLNILAYQSPIRYRLDAFSPLLGKMTDRALANLAGASQSAIYKRRRAQGIAAYGNPERASWKSLDSLLGTMTDQALGDLAGVSKQAISARRKAKGIASFRRYNKKGPRENYEFIVRRPMPNQSIPLSFKKDSSKNSLRTPSTAMSRSEHPGGERAASRHQDD